MCPNCPHPNCPKCGTTHPMSECIIYKKEEKINKIETVGDLLQELSKFPEDMEIRDYNFEKIEKIEIKTWTQTNYPYDKPNKDYVCIF